MRLELLSDGCFVKLGQHGYDGLVLRQTADHIVDAGQLLLQRLGRIGEGIVALGGEGLAQVIDGSAVKLHADQKDVDKCQHHGENGQNCAHLKLPTGFGHRRYLLSLTGSLWEEWVSR